MYFHSFRYNWSTMMGKCTTCPMLLMWQTCSWYPGGVGDSLSKSLILWMVDGLAQVWLLLMAVEMTIRVGLGKRRSSTMRNMWTRILLRMDHVGTLGKCLLLPTNATMHWKRLCPLAKYLGILVSSHWLMVNMSWLLNHRWLLGNNWRLLCRMACR